MQSAAAVTLMQLLIFFAEYTATVTYNAFQWAGQLRKLPFPFGELDPIQYMVPWAIKWHLEWFSRFCRAQQTDRQTHTHIHTLITLLHL